MSGRTEAIAAVVAACDEVGLLTLGREMRSRVADHLTRWTLLRIVHAASAIMEAGAYVDSRPLTEGALRLGNSARHAMSIVDGEHAAAYEERPRNPLDSPITYEEWLSKQCEVRW